MEMKRPSDIELIRSALIFRKSGKLDPFLEVAGIWAITYARDIFGIHDGLETEMYFVIQKKRDECFRIFKEKSLLKFPHFFNRYCRHLVLNMLRVHRKRKNQNYLSLWNEQKYENPELTLYRHDKIYDLTKAILRLPPVSKIILCLRFNIELDIESKNLLEKLLQKRKIRIESFYQSYSARIRQNQEQKEMLMQRLNSINRKIFNNKGMNPRKLKDRKKQIARILEKPNSFITFKELGFILGIPTHKINLNYNDAIRKIQFRLKEEKAA